MDGALGWWMHFWGCHKAMDSHTLFFTHREHLFFTRQVKYHLAFVTGLGKGFPGHKPVLVRQFTVQTLERKKKKKSVSFCFPIPAHPHCGSGFTAGSKEKISVCEGAKGCSYPWPGEVGNKPDEKQRWVLKCVERKQGDYFSYLGNRELWNDGLVSSDNKGSAKLGSWLSMKMELWAWLVQSTGVALCLSSLAFQLAARRGCGLVLLCVCAYMCHFILRGMKGHVAPLKIKLLFRWWWSLKVAGD